MYIWKTENYLKVSLNYIDGGEPGNSSIKISLHLPGTCCSFMLVSKTKNFKIKYLIYDILIMI